MIEYVPIAGTNEHGASWCKPGSLFDTYLTRLGITRRQAARQFWSRALAGTFFTGSGHRVWQFGGDDLRVYLDSISSYRLARTILIAHSYGGAVLAYALAKRPRIRVGAIITVGTPIRRDLDEVWEVARTSTQWHVHLYGTGFGSWMRWVGQRGRFARRMRWADLNYSVKGGHSGVLRKAQHIPQFAQAITSAKAAIEFNIAEAV